MSKATLTQTMSQTAGTLLVAGGLCGIIAAFSQFQPDNHYTYYGIYQAVLLLIMPGFLFIGLGCCGLALRYEQHLTAFGRWALYVMGIGSVGMAFGAVAASIQATLWNVWFVSAVMHVGALIVFGVLFAQKPFLPIFRFLPLQMAAGWLMIAGVTDLFPQTADHLLTFLMLFGIHVAWIAIGLKARQPQVQSAQPTVFAVMSS